MYDLEGLKKTNYYIDKLHEKYNKDRETLNNHLFKCNDLIKKKIMVDIHKTPKKSIIQSTINTMYNVKKNKVFKGGSNNNFIKIKGGSFNDLHPVQKNILNNISGQSIFTGGGGNNNIDSLKKKFENIGNNFFDEYYDHPSNTKYKNIYSTRLFIIVTCLILFFTGIIIGILYYCFCK